MGQRLPPRENELYKRCDEVLHYIWDPIGVSGAAAARDEYSSYVPKVFALLRDEAEAGKIVDYLTSIEESAMGLTPDPGRVRTRRTVDVLLDWRDWIWERFP